MMTNDDSEFCWVCNSLDVVYVDVVGCGWCQVHMEEIYFGGATGWQ